MKINKKLNLVIPVEDDEGEKIYIHSAAIDNETFEKYHRVIGKTFATIYQDGLNVIAGPRVAAMVLKEVAIELGRWEGADGVENGLMNEIRRLSNVSICDADGWKSIPLDMAIKRDLIDVDTVKEAEGKIVFFTLCSTMHTGAQRTAVLKTMIDLWDVELTSQNCTEYSNSLPTSTEEEIIPSQESLLPS